jgi:hypothetical protein
MSRGGTKDPRSRPCDAVAQADPSPLEIEDSDPSE